VVGSRWKWRDDATHLNDAIFHAPEGAALWMAKVVPADVPPLRDHSIHPNHLTVGLTVAVDRVEVKQVERFVSLGRQAGWEKNMARDGTLTHIHHSRPLGLLNICETPQMVMKYYAHASVGSHSVEKPLTVVTV